MEGGGGDGGGVGGEDDEGVASLEGVGVSCWSVPPRCLFTLGNLMGGCRGGHDQSII